MKLRPKLPVFTLIILCITMFSIPYLSGVPSPNTNSACEPGNCTAQRCRAVVYQSGSQAVDKDGITGVGNKATGTDDAVIQDAINNVLDAGRTRQESVCVQGAFSIQAPILIPSYTSLDLTNARLTLANSKNTDLLRSGNYPSTGNCDNVTITGGIIDGNKANNAGFGSNTFLGCNHVLVDGTTVQNAQGTGFLFSASKDIVVRNTHIYNPNSDGLTCYNGSFNCFFIGNYITGMQTSSNGILLLGTEAGGQITSGNLEAIGNQITLTNTGQGISVRSGADNSTVLGNQISCATALCNSGSASIGIYFFSQLGQAVTTRANVQGNVVRLGTASTSFGISVNDDGSSSTNKQVSILQNLIEAHTGISVQGASSLITVAWNDVRNTITGVATGASITNVFVGYNSGFVTINSGATTVADGGTINHGLASITPTLVTCTTTVANQVCAVTALGGVNFTVAIKVDSTGAAGTSQTVYWYAQYCPSPQFRCSP